jgi:hypothetical protein
MTEFMTPRQRRKRDKKARELQARQNTVAFSRKLLADITTTAKLYCKKRVPQNGRNVTDLKMMFGEDGKLIAVKPQRHHRSPTKAERRRARAHQAKLRRGTMKSFYAAGGRLTPLPEPGQRVSSDESYMSFVEGITKREARIRLQDELAQTLGYA